MRARVPYNVPGRPYSYYSIFGIKVLNKLRFCVLFVSFHFKSSYKPVLCDIIFDICVCGYYFALMSVCVRILHLSIPTTMGDIWIVVLRHNVFVYFFVHYQMRVQE